MATKPHSVVRLSGIESDVEGRSYGDTIVVVNEDGGANYWSWRDMMWVGIGPIPDTALEEHYRPKATPKKKPKLKVRWEK